jgi:mannose-6-phosphate isomerase-like protein (cupin superfamily)
VRHDPSERTYATLHQDSTVELYVVCWDEGHDTGFHDHDESAAAVAVVEGTLTEERLAFDSTVRLTLKAGHRVAIPHQAIHRVRHAGQGPAVSVHAYSPPLQRVGAYEIADNGALLRHPRSSEQPLAIAS